MFFFPLVERLASADEELVLIPYCNQLQGFVVYLAVRSGLFLVQVFHLTHEVELSVRPVLRFEVIEVHSRTDVHPHLPVLADVDAGDRVQNRKQFSRRKHVQHVDVVFVDLVAEHCFGEVVWGTGG